MKTYNLAINFFIFIFIFILVVFSTNLYAGDDVDTISKLAEGGNAEAQYELAEMYNIGKGEVKEDFKEAVKWWKLSAAQGYKNSIIRIHNFHLPFNKGQEAMMQKKYADAFKWFELSKMMGHQEAYKLTDIMRDMLKPEEIKAGEDTAAMLWNLLKD